MNRNVFPLFNLGVAIAQLGLLSFSAGPLLAQTLQPVQVPEPALPGVPSRPKPSPLPPTQNPPLVTPTLAPQPQELPVDADDTFRVEKFEFEGNTVFRDEKLEEVVAPFQGREVSFTDLQTLLSAVTRLYTEAGYITSGAYIPVLENQDFQLDRAVLTIQVIEGTLEAINIRGSNRLQKYVRSRLKTATSPVLDQPRLLEALRLLQVNPLFEQISAELAAGSALGKSILNVQIKPEQPFNAAVILDNERTPSVGSFQRRVQLGHANLLGLGDDLSLTYRNTSGSNAVQGSYTLPVNPQNGTVRLAVTNLDSNIIEDPFNQLDIIADFRSYELTYRQPLLRRATDRATQEFALGLTGSRQESEASLLGKGVPISAGADAQGRTRLSVLRFFQEWTQQSNQEVIFARSQFSLGIDAFDSTINETGPASRFLAWRGQAYWQRRLPFGPTLLLRSDLQLADRALVPIEQFTLGGPSTVRGYRQDLLLGNNGFQVSAELGIPVASGNFGSFQFIPFFDVGTIWGTSSQIALATRTLAAVGVGVQYELDDRFRARLDYGVPLVNVDSSDNTWQEQGFTFSLQFQPF